MRDRNSGWLDIMHPLGAAFQLLSRFPVPAEIPFDNKVLSRSVVCYPFVGLAIGLVLAGAGWGLSLVLPPVPAAALVTGLWVALTGGFHLDGLMDTADGILSHRSREEMLAIMKDSRVGAMGAAVCVLQMLIKFALLEGLLEAGWQVWAGLLPAVAIWSRWAMAAAVAWWPYARSGGGLGGLLSGFGGKHLAVCTVLAAGLSAGAGVLGGGSLLTSMALALGLGLPALGFGVLLARRLAAKLGGLTGDTYGAINELTETFLLLVILVLSRFY
ncbi:Cobalamin synthase [compost metagenome]